MRSRPATWTALLCGTFCLPSSTHEAWGSSPHTNAQRAPVKDGTRQVAIGKANFATQPAALRWPTASPAVCGGLCEEAATPGQPFTYRSTLWRNPPDNSPSRITRNRRLCRNALAGHAEHLAAMSALCAFTRMCIKRKSACVCEEAVNARDSLWKALEKPGRTPTSRAAVYRHKQPSTLPCVGTPCSAHYAARAG